ncbi:MAG: L-fuculokinase [Thermomicrobiales bacterium]
MPGPNATNRRDPLLVGLDMGSTSVKAVVYEPTGKAVARASVPSAVHYPRPAWAHYSPDELWAQAVHVLREAVEKLDDPRRIAGIAVASVGEAGVPLDEDGNPTYDFIAWFDQRTLKQQAFVEQAVGEDRCFEITGLSIAPIFSLCKLLWIKDNHPDAWNRTRRWLHVADYVAYRLSGAQATDWSLASRTMAFDIRKRVWSDELLKIVGIDRALFAEPVASGTAIGQVTAEAAQATGLPAGAVIATGGQDHVCGALAAGVTSPGTLLDSLGTAEAICVALDQPLGDPNLGRQGYSQGAHVAPGQYYVYGGVYTSGASINWWKDVLSVDHDAMIAEAALVPAGSLGVGFLPHLRMGNPPHMDARSRGAFVGLTTDVNRGVLTRAVFEGLAFEARATLEPLLDFAGLDALGDVTMIGGGTRNDLLTKIKASVYNAKINVVDLEEATALGAAILAGIGAGVYRDVADALHRIQSSSRVVEPTQADVPAYDAYYREVYAPLYSALRTVNHVIHRLAHNESGPDVKAGA